MQNKTPIVVLTGLGIVAAAAVAGLTRDQWMGQKTEVVAVAPAPEAPKAPETPEVPAVTPEATPPAQPPAATAEQPAAPEPAQQQTAAVPPSTQPEAPAAVNGGEAPKVPAFDTVRVEKTGEAVIAGTAAPGAEVVVKLDGKVIGQTTANSDGAFVLVPATALPVGSGALTLEAKAPGAAEATPSQQSVAVIVPAADQPQEALVAVVSPDQPTRVLQKPAAKPGATPAPATAPAAETPAKLVSIDAVDYDQAGNIVFSGQGNEGNTARVYIDNNFIGDAPVGADGHWTFSATADIAPGVHTLRVDGLDTGGKVLNRVEVPFVREEQKKVAEATETPPAPAAPPAAESESAAKSDAEVPSAPADATPPTATPPAATTPAKPRDGRVVIQPGNNLWTIARVLYGNGAKFTMLYEANKNQIRDPDRIYPGQVFKTPDVAPTSESIDPKRREPLKPEENAASGQ
ncbi:hypothetical protein DK847_04375 [Aestuariivirga litoralis]|uniref:LysM domain-containing protein n=1 Tax=Aestuariivirga litoralis TaxID=2650924 RepID=A0A2W2BBX8_9HYPH|nr:Ig-like domain-containing protein [Aestuariivirga litoralis]PZF77678.1 hypothetical protein DK847_04375 [Aestuariivirga litoralis]